MSFVVHVHPHKACHYERREQKDFDIEELLYAADILLFSKRARSVYKLLKLLFEESEYLNLEVNKSKFVGIQHDTRSKIILLH